METFDTSNCKKIWIFFKKNKDCQKKENKRMNVIRFMPQLNE